VAVREIISSYGQPIIAGLTPYTVTSVDPYAEIRDPDWPPYVDDARLQTYIDYTHLIENSPAEVFEDLRAIDSATRTKILVAVALPELLATVWADAVWSDPPTLDFTSDAVAAVWDAIDEANDFTEIGGWESVFGTAGWGTSVLRLRRDSERAARMGLATDVVIEEIDPAIFFPKLRKGSAREIESVTLAWTEDRSVDDGTGRVDHWQVRELHEIVDGQYTITYQERKTSSAADRTPFRTIGAEQPEGVDFLPFVDMHAKRWRGRYWGVSELQRNLSLFDEVDNTLSNIAEILEYHGKPMLQVPASVIYGGTLTKGADKTLGIRRAEEAGIAKYITFEGMLDQQLASLDKNLELAFLTAEVPGRYFGIGAADAPPSGVSYKLQLQNYLKKATRYQRNETMRLKTLIPMALRLEGLAAGDLVPKVTHGSPLPADDEQDARIEQGLYGAGMSSLELSIRKLRRVPSDEIDDEIARIEQDKEDSIGRLPAPLRSNASGGGAFPAATGGNSSNDPNAGDGPAA
jgi:hypothetical protein